MSEKRVEKEKLDCKKKYVYEYNIFWECNDGSKSQILEDDVVDLLNNLNDDVKHLEEYSADLEADVKRFEEENERLRNHKKVLDEDNTDKYFQIRKQEQQIKKLQEINEELSEKIKELSFNDYKRCLEIINHQRTIIQKIEKLTGQSIARITIYKML